MLLRRGLGLCAVLVLLVAACTDDDVEPASTGTTLAADDGATATTPRTEPAPVGGLLATVTTNRLFATRHAFGLGLRNVGDVPVEVAAVQLESSFYEPVAASEEPVLLQTTGRRFVLPLPYGEPRCGDVEERYTIVVTLTDGRELRVPAVDEYPGAIARLHARECFTLEVRERADLRFGDEWTQEGISIHGELLLDQRVPGGAIAVDDVRGNVIFTFVVEGDDEHPILAVDEDEPSASVPVTISADRCDPHAVAEFKTPFLMLGWVSLDGGEPTGVTLEATGGARAALEQLIADCSTG